MKTSIHDVNKAIAEMCYIEFTSYDDAFEAMVRMNVNLKRHNRPGLFCLVPGPEDNYVIVDDRTAIELGLGYVFSSNTCGWVANPWVK